MGNPYLDPELNYQAEFSMQHMAGRLKWEGSLFYSVLQDYITAVVDPDLPRKYMPMQEPRFAKRFINVDDAMQTGFELSLTYDLTEAFGFSGDLSYTYGQNKSLDEPLPQVPPLTGHLGVHYRKEKIWVYANSRLVAEQSRISESFGEEATPGFATLDVSGGFVPWRGVQVGLSVLNVFDTAYYEHLNYSYTNSDLNQGRIYEPGRNFTAYVRFDF